MGFISKTNDQHVESVGALANSLSCLSGVR